jgi:hypothetical protein
VGYVNVNLFCVVFHKAVSGYTVNFIADRLINWAVNEKGLGWKLSWPFGGPVRIFALRNKWKPRNNSVKMSCTQSGI